MEEGTTAEEGRKYHSPRNGTFTLRVDESNLNQPRHQQKQLCPPFGYYSARRRQNPFDHADLPCVERPLPPRPIKLYTHRV